MSRLELVIRIQYTFKATDVQLSLLLTLNVKKRNNPHVVNVVAISSSKRSSKSCHNHVRMIVGTDDPTNPARGGAGDPENPDPDLFNAQQNQQFRRNLRRLGIPYRKDPVIQILNVERVTGTPGIFRIYHAALVCARINVLAFYEGERALLYPLRTCQCRTAPSSKKTEEKFADEVISAFIQVPIHQLCLAFHVLASLKMGTPESPFAERQLCINARNVERVIKKHTPIKR